MSTDIALVARQPIYDRRLKVVGYEVLYRTVGASSADVADPDQATATVSIHALLDLGLDRLVRGSRAWINVTRGVLVGRMFEFLPPARVVLEILESVEADPEVLEALAHAKSLGYCIALDDFVLNERTAALIPFAEVIKLDVLGCDAEGLRRRFLELSRPGLELLAEKVETHEAFELAQAAGFTLFQGYFFARPLAVEARRPRSDRTQLLRTVARLNDADVTIEEIQRLVASNIGLSLNLLRYVNSAALGRPARIESIQHAVMMLGLTRVRTCVMMLILSGMDEKPHELMLTALVRARFCHLLGEARGDDPQPYFTTGLLSVIDAFMDQPMHKLVPQLSVSRELEDALVRHEGPLGEVLETVLACEAADWERLLGVGLQDELLRFSYLDALGWASETDSSISG